MTPYEYRKSYQSPTDTGKAGDYLLSREDWPALAAWMKRNALYWQASYGGPLTFTLGDVFSEGKTNCLFLDKNDRLVKWADGGYPEEFMRKKMATWIHNLDTSDDTDIPITRAVLKPEQALAPPNLDF